MFIIYRITNLANQTWSIYPADSFRTLIAESLLVLVIAVMLFGRTTIALVILTTLTVGCSTLLITKFSQIGAQKEWTK